MNPHWTQENRPQPIGVIFHHSNAIPDARRHFSAFTAKQPPRAAGISGAARGMRAIKNMQKITKAMKMVATAKFKKDRREASCVANGLLTKLLTILNQKPFGL